MLRVEKMTVAAENGHESVHNVSLTAAEGETIVCFGPLAEDGIETFMKAVAGQYALQNGKVRIGGVDLLDQRRAALDQMAWVGAPSWGRYGGLTVEENLWIRGENAGDPSSRRLQQMLKDAHLLSMMDRPVHQL
ncbi:MAG: hypothetical protein OWS74_01360, partial [Firmicutes bacterium]|nr:hypothetical protein [Bacillota bacterium]